MQHKLGLHIFRRDLRLEDNTALQEALSTCEEVIPCFIFDERQITKNPYKGVPALQFLIESLEDLNKALEQKGTKLYIFKGIAEEAVQELITKLSIDCVFINEDYTPFSRKRDRAIQEVCEEKNIYFSVHADALLHQPGTIIKDDGKPYTVFTPFFRKARQYSVKEPISNNHTNYFTKEILQNKTITYRKEVLSERKNYAIPGGRTAGKQLLANITSLQDYKEERDIPSLNATSHLAPHHKFGTISIRETYYQIAKTFSTEHTLISELYWRDFFTSIAFHFPHVFTGAFKQQYDAINWSTNKAHLQAWKEGQTGVPIVDAGMRELAQTGYMHNRVRMIVASYLVKDLHISWREGEQHFAQTLLDYDPSVNNGNWQWAASTGCDAQPYFRIFNPWRQQERFDPDCSYIKKWVEELSELTPKEIQNLEQQRPLTPLTYPKPLVNHKEAAEQAKAMFANIK